MNKILCMECNGEGWYFFIPKTDVVGPHGIMQVIEPCDICNGEGLADEETPEEHRAFMNKVAGILRSRDFKVEVNE